MKNPYTINAGDICLYESRTIVVVIACLNSQEYDSVIKYLISSPNSWFWSAGQVPSRLNIFKKYVPNPPPSARYWWASERLLNLIMPKSLRHTLKDHWSVGYES